MRRIESIWDLKDAQGELLFYYSLEGEILEYIELIVGGTIVDNYAIDTRYLWTHDIHPAGYLGLSECDNEMITEGFRIYTTHSPKE